MERRVHSRRSKIARTIALFQRDIPEDELDAHDLGCLRTATRLVFETEDLALLVHSGRAEPLGSALSDWRDSLEAAIEFMSWIRCLAEIVDEQTYPKEARVQSIGALWERHGTLAKRLLDPKLKAERRLSLLVELGGIELRFLGHYWWRRPAASSNPKAPRQRERGTMAGQRARKKVAKSDKA
jgi:hypothetical protein